MHVIDAPAPSFEGKNMEFTQKLRARIISILTPVFTIAFVSVPLIIGGGVMFATVDVLMSA
jgi:hypothetical protein